MKRYNEYKDSGVEWIGEVPSHWEIRKIKTVLSQNSNGIKIGPFGSALTGKVGEKLPYKIYGQWNIVGRDFNAGTNTVNSETYNKLEGSYKVVPGDILISMMGTIGKCAVVPKGIEPGIMDSHVVKVRLDAKFILDKYFEYIYDKDYSNVIINELERVKGGSIMDGLNSKIIKNLRICLPPLEEQSIIASYLDKKCCEIDIVISAQQKRIALLQELKQSVITHAVTKGLNPNVEMKDSGVEWIDKIPANWAVLPLKRLGAMNKGLTFTKADLVEKGNPAISYGQVHSKLNDGVCLQGSLIRYVPDSFVSNSKKSIAYQGDFIFADTSEDYEGCGNCVYNDTRLPIYGGYHTIVVQTKSANAKYLAYLFKTDYWRYQIRSRVYGVKVYSITQSILSLCSVILPPKETQQSIVSFLDKECNAINVSIDNAFAQIDLLQEYKQSLITEVVTGKRKVS